MIREAIILRLKELDISQAELCRRLELNRGNFNAFLRGGTFPLKDLERVLINLGLEVCARKRHRMIVNVDGREVECELMFLDINL